LRPEVHAETRAREAAIPMANAFIGTPAYGFFLPNLRQRLPLSRTPHSVPPAPDGRGSVVQGPPLAQPGHVVPFHGYPPCRGRFRLEPRLVWRRPRTVKMRRCNGT